MSEMLSNTDPPPNSKSSKSISKSLISSQEWRKFTKEFPTEKECVEELYRIVYGHSLKCFGCESEHVLKLKNSRVIICQNCKRESHTLAGTLFDKIRRPRAWLGAIYYLERGVAVNASQFARDAGLVSSSAQAIFKKLTHLVIGRMDNLPEVSSEEFGSTFTKRSRISPASEAPRARQNELEYQQNSISTIQTDTAELNALSTVDNISNVNGEKTNTQSNIEETLSDLEKKVFEVLTHELQHIDLICKLASTDFGKALGALIVLETWGLVESFSNNRFALCRRPELAKAKSPSDKRAKKTIASFIRFVHSTFQGISRKYLQNYLAWFWYITDRKTRKIASLRNGQLCFGKLTYQEVLEYISPAFVRISPV